MAFGARRIATSVPANSSVDILAGQAVGQSIEFPGRPFAANVAAAGSATGLQLTVQLSSDLVLDRAQVPVEVAANRGPVLPDDTMGTFVGASSDRIIIRATNTTAGALTITVYIDVSPV